ncbi:MAG: hypothetical protein A2504_17430 [Bdellovibrionales bacterium RIFOXYD12_FULL_39_22]|nr:MAG: hypothetical protein A2385_10530 [Bdellovibrionales bacterium RIFOXYB1_FULL_39_21]OFZ40785.1 MAG: hypothetical protein A2485_17200 [Bdellovibrionales bacterium RIFOXYC12_FULL_39_17]OFZ48207.1 MAG: hypothetical protein A2404_17360 [Bdellovibrionales bacterium RIFOXYC1_FULL_39_130]OFZ70636.1 MAG: hypothetical protein A2451_06915 [Bdellovibrionales bacterium RIFOXYC2_FULL_39_8]OFZ75857.1 MAG: hypothetical protein A2560_13860 [Bdellovibrionales bacterium RIFOXYD1_FULL_39_84]OFZ91918.1 MAG:
MKKNKIKKTPSRPTFLIIAGDGINCEKETKLAFQRSHAEAEIMHINDLLTSPARLFNFQGLAIPGGFSFGDELGSGQIMALKFKAVMNDLFQEYVAQRHPIIGICNGFQILVKMNLLPESGKKKRMFALAPNYGRQFIDRWVTLEVASNSICKWTEAIKGKKIRLPIRNGEGRVVFDKKWPSGPLYLAERGQIPLRYESKNSEVIDADSIAGVCDESGFILGMMPHPEAILLESHQHAIEDDILKSMVTYLQHS